MKELSIEEKAKAYDEAIEKAKAWCDCEHATTDDKILLKRIFPELKESEDDEIRKSIIAILNNYVDDSNTFKPKMLAWLEKQDEQKPAWSEEDESIMNAIYKFLDGSDALSVDQQQAKYWLKSLKDRVQPQPVQEWSEEKENNILFLTSIIEECFKNKEKITLYGDTVCANFTKEDVIDRLKSIRPQNRWKPSELQIEALESATANCAYSEYQDCLRELIGQLKKLREE